MIAPEQTYLAKLNYFLAGIFSCVVLFDLGIALFVFGEDPFFLLMMLSSTVMACVVLTIILLPRRYTLKADHLEIRTTFSRERIPYASIQAATFVAQPNPLLPEHFKVEMADGSFDQVFPAPGPAKKFLAEMSSRVEADRPSAA